MPPVETQERQKPEWAAEDEAEAAAAAAEAGERPATEEEERLAAEAAQQQEEKGEGFEGGGGEVQDDSPPEITVAGSSQQLSLSGIGGHPVTTSTITLQGGALGLEGQFKKGERVRLYIEADVTEVAFTDRKDPKTGNVTACRRGHKATVVGCERLADEE